MELEVINKEDKSQGEKAGDGDQPLEVKTEGRDMTRPHTWRAESAKWSPLMQKVAKYVCGFVCVFTQRKQKQAIIAAWWSHRRTSMQKLFRQANLQVRSFQNDVTVEIEARGSLWHPGFCLILMGSFSVSKKKSRSILKVESRSKTGHEKGGVSNLGG